MSQSHHHASDVASFSIDRVFPPLRTFPTRRHFLVLPLFPIRRNLLIRRPQQSQQIRNRGACPAGGAVAQPVRQLAVNALHVGHRRAAPLLDLAEMLRRPTQEDVRLPHLQDMFIRLTSVLQPGLLLIVPREIPERFRDLAFETGIPWQALTDGGVDPRDTPCPRIDVPPVLMSAGDDRLPDIPEVVPGLEDPPADRLVEKGGPEKRSHETVGPGAPWDGQELDDVEGRAHGRPGVQLVLQLRDQRGAQDRQTVENLGAFQGTLAGGLGLVDVPEKLIAHIMGAVGGQAMHVGEHLGAVFDLLDGGLATAGSKADHVGQQWPWVRRAIQLGGVKIVHDHPGDHNETADEQDPPAPVCACLGGYRVGCWDRRRDGRWVRWGVGW